MEEDLEVSISSCADLWPFSCVCTWGGVGKICCSCGDCVCVCVVRRGYNGRLMKAWGFTEMSHEAAVQIMLQLCSKDSPAVLRISPCAYVIRTHGTAARPGASDPENLEWDEMGGKWMDGWRNGARNTQDETWVFWGHERAKLPVAQFIYERRYNL